MAPTTLTELRAAAVAAHQRGELETALAQYGRYLEQRPTDSGILSNLGALLRTEGQYDLALQAHRRAHALDMSGRGVRNNLANILSDIGHHAEALSLRQALGAEEPGNPDALAMICKTLRSMGKHDEGIAEMEAAIAAHPDHAELKIQLALTQLAAGRYGEGFATYGARWETGELQPRQMPCPQWDGGSLEGKRILVLPEQGFGDAIAFLRFLPVLRQFNPAQVILSGEGPIMRLLGAVDGADAVVKGVPDAAAYDTWTNIMDLPGLHFEADPAVPPPAKLTVPDDSRGRARAFTAAHRDKFRIGVVWTGSLTYRGNAFRSFSHTQFHSLLDLPDMQMFSLYKGPKLDAFRADGSAGLMIDAGGRDRDFGDTAALMQEMDLIITSDTATAHIAGTLGVRVWTLLHWDAFWLWQIERDTTPWYPTMQLIRQSAPRDWDSVFAEVKRRLAQETSR